MQEPVHDLAAPFLFQLLANGLEKLQRMAQVFVNSCICTGDLEEALGSSLAQPCYCGHLEPADRISLTHSV